MKEGDFKIGRCISYNNEQGERIYLTLPLFIAFASLQKFKILMI